MNIHIEDKELFEELKRISLFNIKIGSIMYGLGNKESDVDILYVYVPSEDEINSISSSFHQYQFKEDGVDYMFCDIFTFIKNSLSGDSTINFEVINDVELRFAGGNWLFNIRDKFRNYKILRAYLGRARKDLKQMRSKSETRDISKKLYHGIRSYYAAKEILEDDFYGCLRDADYYDELVRVRNMSNKRKMYNLAEDYQLKISVLREKLNHLNDTGLLSKEYNIEYYMSIKDIHELDELISSVVKQKRKEVGDSNYFEKVKYLAAKAVSEGIDYGGDSKYIVS